jgi:CRP-like cAMP-binding protein
MDLKFLKQVSLLKDLTPEELEIFAKKLKLVRFKENDAIITENKLSDKLFILYSGEVCISKKMTMIDEQEQIDKTFIILKSMYHVFFGEIGLLGFQKRTATATAKTDCELFTINQQDFMNICILYNKPAGFHEYLHQSSHDRIQSTAGNIQEIIIDPGKNK